MKKLLASILAASMVLSMGAMTTLAVSPSAKSTRQIHQLQDKGDLRDLMTRVNDGDTIQLNGSGFVNDVNDSQGNGGLPWVIDKQVTITGGSINLRAGGIVLEKDLTLKDTKLLFANGLRNAIIANGHTLRLENVALDTTQAGNQTANDVHLFCGGLTGLPNFSAKEGTGGTIIIAGTTSLNNIYAGSISHNPSNEVSNEYSKQATIRFENASKSKMGKIFASGAKQAPAPGIFGGKADPPTADPAFKSTGGVTIELYNAGTREIDGRTGGKENAKVIYNGDQNQNGSLAVSDLSSFTIQSGNLEFPESSNLTNTDISIAGAADTKLSLIKLKDPQIKNISGGTGTLILGQKQTLTVTGKATGNTKVAIGGIFNDFSSQLPVKNQIYIKAVNSEKDSFKLVPHSANPKQVLENDGKGDWTVGDGSSTATVKIASFNIPTPPVFPVENAGTVYIPIDLTTDPVDGVFDLDTADKISVTVNGTSASRTGDTTNGFRYSAPSQKVLDMGFGVFDIGLALEIIGTGDLGKLPVGSYRIGLTIPKDYMKNNQNLFPSVVIEVKDIAPPPTPGKENLQDATIAITGGNNFPYTGAEQKPEVTVTLKGQTVPKTDYDLTYQKNKDVGTAIITVTAKGSSATYTGMKQTTFQITPAQLSYAITGITEKTYDGTKTADATGITFTKVPTNAETLSASKDYTVSAEFDSADAGTNKSVNVQVALKGKAEKNYTLTKSTQTVQNQQIKKAAAPTAKTGQLDVMNNHKDIYTYNLRQLLPQLTDGKNLGTTSFKLGTVTLNGYQGGTPTISNSTLTVPIADVADSKEGKIGTIQIQVESQNYQNFDAIIEVYATNKSTLKGEPSLSQKTLREGQPLSDIKLSGNLTDMAGKEVDGLFEWVDPAYVYSVGGHDAEWKFTPKDTSKYQITKGTSRITILGKDDPLPPPIGDFVDEDGKLSDLDEVRPEKKYYTPIANDIVPGIEQNDLADSKLFDVDLKKVQGSKAIESISIVEKSINGGPRQAQIEIKTKEIMGDEEIKVVLDGKVKPTKKAMEKYESLGLDAEYSMGRIVLFISNEKQTGDQTYEVGQGRVVLKPESNENNEVIWENDSREVARLHFTADSEAKQFYPKLSTKWDSSFDSQIGNAQAHVVDFVGNPELSANSRATLELVNPFYDRHNEIYTARLEDAKIYEVVDGKLVDVTKKFQIRENENGDQVLVLRTRQLGKYIITDGTAPIDRKERTTKDK